jgi:hypothetical protein
MAFVALAAVVALGTAPDTLAPAMVPVAAAILASTLCAVVTFCV